MYYREKIIDGVLCFQSLPNGKWHPISQEALTNRIVKLEQKDKDLRWLIENRATIEEIKERIKFL